MVHVTRRNTRFLFDFPLFLSVIALSVIGLLFVYSSNVSAQGEVLTDRFLRQIIWTVIGFLAMVFSYRLDIENIRPLIPVAFIITLILLLITLFMGKVVNGARSWIGIGAIGIQPAEFSKLFLIFFLADFCTKSGKGIARPWGFTQAGIYTLLPVLLILLQPDLGTAMVYPIIFLGMMYFSGAKLRHVVFCTFLLLLTFGGIVWGAWMQWTLRYPPAVLQLFMDRSVVMVELITLFAITLLSLMGYFFLHVRAFYWVAYMSIFLMLAGVMIFVALHVLKDYQLERLVVFLDPLEDAQGTGWHIIQSRNAIGSGGIWGKGYLRGLHSHSRFVPEQSTDFIFSILAEEWGFLGGFAVCGLYLIIMIRGMSIVRQLENSFLSLLCFGLTIMLFSHFIINVGVTLGLMPIIGIPLFFLSYGGSGQLIAFISVGILLRAFHKEIQYR